jgi:hypothetical protein
LIFPVLCQVISDIDEQGSWHSGDISAALTEAVTKVASVARELYLPCKVRLCVGQI